MKRHRYWPWAAIFAGGFTAALIALVLIASALEIALHRWASVLTLLAAYCVTCLVIVLLMRRFRDRFDYFIDADEQSLHRWSARGEVTVQRSRVIQIEWGPDSFTVRGDTGEISITRAYAGYRSLRRLVQGWAGGMSSQHSPFTTRGGDVSHRQPQ